MSAPAGPRCGGTFARSKGPCTDAASFRVAYRTDGSDAVESCSKHLAQVVRQVRVAATPNLRRSVRVVELAA
jgi:hypothetical protein